MLRLSKTAAATLALVGGSCYLSGVASQHVARGRDGGLAYAGVADGYRTPGALQDGYLPGSEGTELSAVSQERAAIMPRVAGLKTMILAALVIVLLCLTEHLAEGSQKKGASTLSKRAGEISQKLGQWPDKDRGNAKLFLLLAPVVMMITGLVDLLTSLARRRDARKGRLSPPPFKGLEFVLVGLCLVGAYFVMEVLMLEAAAALIFGGSWKMLTSALSRKKFERQMKKLQEEEMYAAQPH